MVPNIFEAGVNLVREGTWQNSGRRGHGIMTFLRGELIRIEGTWNNQFLDSPATLMYVYTPPSLMCSRYRDCRIYKGKIDEDRTPHGTGELYIPIREGKKIGAPRVDDFVISDNETGTVSVNIVTPDPDIISLADIADSRSTSETPSLLNLSSAVARSGLIIPSDQGDDQEIQAAVISFARSVKSLQPKQKETGTLPATLRQSKVNILEQDPNVVKQLSVPESEVTGSPTALQESNAPPSPIANTATATPSKQTTSFPTTTQTNIEDRQTSMPTHSSGKPTMTTPASETKHPTSPRRVKPNTPAVTSPTPLQATTTQAATYTPVTPRKHFIFGHKADKKHDKKRDKKREPQIHPPIPALKLTTSAPAQSIVSASTISLTELNLESGHQEKKGLVIEQENYSKSKSERSDAENSGDMEMSSVTKSMDFISEESQIEEMRLHMLTEWEAQKPEAFRKFTSTWTKGVMAATGKCEFPNGSIYEGAFENYILCVKFNRQY